MTTKTGENDDQRLNPSTFTSKDQSKDQDHEQLLTLRDQPQVEIEKAKDPTPTPYAWLVLFLMVLNSMFNQWQRYNISYAHAYKGTLGDFRSGDPKFSIDAEYDQLKEWYGYGLLAGLAFTASYATCGLYAGLVSDKVNRKMMLSCAAIAWSSCTLLSGIIKNYWMLFFFRFCIGIFESVFNPCAYGIISDYFHPSSRTTANSIFNLGVYLGGALSSITIILITSLGWRGTYDITGIGGMIIGFVTLFFVIEPKRGYFDPPKAKVVQQLTLGQRWINSAKEIFQNDCCRNATFAASFRFFGGYSIGFFMPSYFGNVYAAYKTEYSVGNAFVVSMCGLVSSLGGAYLADRWEASGNYMGKANICILSAVLGIPTIGLCTLVQSNFYFSLGMLGLEYLVAESWLGPSITMVINTISPENKGFAVSAYLFFATVAGTIATELLNVLQDQFKAKEHPELYGYILFAFVCFSYGGSIPFMWLAGKHYKIFKEKENAEKAALEGN